MFRWMVSSIRPDGGRADPGDQVGRLGRGVGEADLQMVDRLDDDRDATVLGHGGNAGHGLSDPVGRDGGIRLV